MYHHYAPCILVSSFSNLFCKHFSLEICSQILQNYKKNAKYHVPICPVSKLSEEKQSKTKE